MEITAVAAQAVAMGNDVNFTETVIPGNCSIIHREGSGIVKLRAHNCQQCRARFRVTFNGNIAVPAGGTAGPISLVLAIDGEGIEATRMIVTPAATGEYMNIGASIYVDVPKCCCSTVGVKNDQGPAILVQNANLIVERVA